MTINEARDILALLGPTLEDAGRWAIAISDGQLAAIILADEPANVTRADFLTALELREQLGGGFLVVL